MLVLTRRINESIHIGNNIKLTILSTNSSQIRIGIDAPKIIPVNREEIYEKINHATDEEA